MTITKCMKHCLIILILAFPLLSDAAEKDNQKKLITAPKLNLLNKLKVAQPSDIKPTGELPEVLTNGSDFTSIQRDLKIKEALGKVALWSLPVYDVKKSGNEYIILTYPGFDGKRSKEKLISTVLHVVPRDKDDRDSIESLKRGEFIKIKGIIKSAAANDISGILEISPAILIYDWPARKLFNDVYGYKKYNKDYDCWFMSKNDSNYCMRIGRIEKESFNGLERYHILALGDVVDEDGGPNGSHAEIGMIGVFVIELHNDEPDIISSDLAMPMGAFGVAPTSWEFVKLNSLNYWGWRTEVGDCHYGDCYTKKVLLAPHGEKFQNLTEDFLSTTENPLPIDFTIDSSKKSETIFPLQLHIMDKNGNSIITKKVQILFDDKKWKYLLPTK